MKHIIILASTCVLGFSSCDPGQSIDPGMLIGIWKVDSVEYETLECRIHDFDMYCEFREDGTYIGEHGMNEPTDSMAQQYMVADNIVYLEGLSNERVSQEYQEILLLDDSLLTIRSTNEHADKVIVYFSKVDE